jgi:hypothetical protein
MRKVKDLERNAEKTQKKQGDKEPTNEQTADPASFLRKKQLMSNGKKYTPRLHGRNVEKVDLKRSAARLAFLGTRRTLVRAFERWLHAIDCNDANFDCLCCFAYRFDMFGIVRQSP